MTLFGSLRILASIVAIVPVVAGCAGVSYREESKLSHTRYALIENFGDAEITAEQVDGLLEEVAEILDVELDRSKPKVRIMVRPSGDIAALFRQTTTIAGHGIEARALYFAGATLAVIPFYDRTILGHELAHYLTDHYLKGTPRQHWERIAHKVENALPLSAPVARRTPPTGVSVRAATVPLGMWAN